MSVEGRGELLRRGGGRRGERGRGVVLPGAEGRGEGDRGPRRLLARREGRMRAARMKLLTRAALAFVVLSAAWGASAQTRPRAAQPKNRAAQPKNGAARWRAALDGVSAESMKGHLSFLASDALEGRRTPSRGLDIAAEYIAAQFRRAGLEPAGDDGYFQTANWRLSARDAAAFRLTFSGGATASA